MVVEEVLTLDGGQNAMYRWCSIGLYILSLYNFINQYYPNKFNKNKNKYLDYKSASM